MLSPPSSPSAAGHFGIKNVQKQITLGMVARVAYGRAGRVLVDTAIAASQLGFCGSALIFCSKNLAAIISVLSNCTVDVNRAYLILAFVPLLIPFVWIRQLARFATAILIADGLIIAGILYIMARNIQHLAVDGVATGIIQFDPVKYAVFLGAAIYALEGTAFVLPIDLAMRDRSRSAEVIVGSSLATGVLYCSFGLIGYLAYGASALTVVTLNVQNEFPGGPFAAAHPVR
jgi:amino acid permease